MSISNSLERAYISTQQLRHFLLVAEQGSFQLAAGKAFRSQPAITKSIQAVERALGHALFEPGQRSTLTPYGEACQPLVAELLRHYDRTLAAMHSLASGASGQLTVASIASVAHNWLSEIVQRLVQDFPGIELHLRDSNSQNIQRMVLAGEADLGICSPVAADARLHLTPLLENNFGFVCRNDHPLAQSTHLTWADLVGTHLIGTTAHRQLLHPCAQRVLAGAKIQTEGVLTLLALLRQGIGATVLPEIAVPPGDRDLVFIALSKPTLSRRVYAMQRKDRTPSLAAASLLQRLLEATPVNVNQARPL